MGTWSAIDKNSKRIDELLNRVKLLEKDIKLIIFGINKKESK